MQNQKKLAFFLPNIFTSLNMACGFASVMRSLQGNYDEACLFLILGAIFDSVDGRVARITGTSSQFGEQFDSMSDLISFGVAPAILMHQKYLFQFERLGAVIAFIYLLCGALRLARFNSNIEKIRSDFFQGLPIPGAATAVIGYVLFFQVHEAWEPHPIVPLIYLFCYSLLMVTTLPFFSFKDSPFISKYKKMGLFIFLVIGALLFSHFRVVTLIILNLYVIISVLVYLKRRKEFGDAFPWSEES